MCFFYKRSLYFFCRENPLYYKRSRCKRIPRYKAKKREGFQEIIYIYGLFMIFFYFAEIRYRLFYCIISFCLCFSICYFYSLELLYLFARPFLHSNHHQIFFEKGFIFTNLTEAFQTTLKICFIWSSAFLLPVIFYQFWCFFTPSWYFFERVQGRVYLFFGTLLNLLGGSLFYFLVLPEVFDCLLNFKVNSPLDTIQLHALIDAYVT